MSKQSNAISRSKGKVLGRGFKFISRKKRFGVETRKRIEL
jgi:hypothetical protein